ncbi:hypothetical protein OROMI_026583 [Orobanche minor]
MASSSNPDPVVNQAPTTENSNFDSSCSLDEEHIQQLVAKNMEDFKKNDTSKPSIWPHFTKYNEPLVEVVDGMEKVVGSTQRCSCNYCDTTFGCDSRGNGTSTLRKYIEIVTKSYSGKANIEEGGQQMLTKNSTMVDGVRTLGSTVWTKESCTDAAIMMIIIDESPFSFIENTCFRHFVMLWFLNGSLQLGR